MLDLHRPDISIVPEEYGNPGLKLNRFGSNIISARRKRVFVLGLTAPISMSRQGSNIQERVIILKDNLPYMILGADIIMKCPKIIISIVDKNVKTRE